MLTDQAISEHYLHGDLLNAIQRAIGKSGKSIANITTADLAPVDEFHIGGRKATKNFLKHLDIIESDHVLDVGCGLGGTARYIAEKYGTQVTGIDLTPEYIETGKTLCSWVNLEKKVTLQQGSALYMPFPDESFDGGYMIHVGMNIDDKTQLFKEVFRVMCSGVSFGVYDIMLVNTGELEFPVPWSEEPKTSRLATVDQYVEAMTAAGFEVYKQNGRRDFAIEYFKRSRKKIAALGGRPAIGLHTLMKESTDVKVTNMVDGITAGLIEPVELIARKP